MLFLGFQLIFFFFFFVVLSVCRRLKDQVMMLEAPLRGVAPMFTALRKLQVSAEHLTPLHSEFLLLCLLSKSYKTGLSILDDDVFEVDQPRDLFLYCYYGCAAFFLSLLLRLSMFLHCVFIDGIWFNLFDIDNILLELLLFSLNMLQVMFRFLQ